MKVCHYEQVDSSPVETNQANGCTVRRLVDPSDGAPNFTMRQLEVAPGGYTPRHHHPHEHEVYILEGSGVVLEGDRERPLKPGDVVFIAPHEVHQFRNTAEVPLKFLCIVPNSAA